MTKYRYTCTDKRNEDLGRKPFTSRLTFETKEEAIQYAKSFFNPALEGLKIDAIPANLKGN